MVSRADGFEGHGINAGSARNLSTGTIVTDITLPSGDQFSYVGTKTD